MSKLVDIKGYWNLTLNPTIESDMWCGKILLEDDGWFEGIVNEPNSSYIGDRMVFGIYHPEKIIELLKISPEDVSNPLIFRGKKSSNGYEGEFSVITLVGEELFGSCLLVTQAAEPLKESNLELEKEELMKKISKFKEKNAFKDLYENYLAVRSLMTKILLNNFSGESFNSEELEEIMKEFQPINKKVEELTMEESRQFIKRMSSTFIPDDDDFPF